MLKNLDLFIYKFTPFNLVNFALLSIVLSTSSLQKDIGYASGLEGLLELLRSWWLPMLAVLLFSSLNLWNNLKIRKIITATYILLVGVTLAIQAFTIGLETSRECVSGDKYLGTNFCDSYNYVVSGIAIPVAIGLAGFSLSFVIYFFSRIAYVADLAQGVFFSLILPVVTTVVFVSTIFVYPYWLPLIIPIVIVAWVVAILIYNKRKHADLSFSN